MIAITSISPKHKMAHAQPNAVDSWIKAGFKVVSINGKAEIETLKKQYPTVEFIECNRTMDGVYKAPYVPISAIIDLAKERQYESIMIINSDIVIKDESKHIQKYVDWCDAGLVIANREDHDGTFANSKRYLYGFDVFMVHSNFYHLIPQSMFCLGQTWWDYWLPYRLIKSGVQVVDVREPIFYHQSHPVQYNGDEWKRMTEHFHWMENISNKRSPQHTNNEVYKFIRSHAK